ncbi:MAG TPA: nucleoside-diphosphate sugar epimerase/dehydratase [Coriobacteriia bacterium]
MRDLVSRIRARAEGLGLSLFAVDALIVFLSMQFAYFSRFGGPPTPEFQQSRWFATALAMVVFLGVFMLFDLYRHVWRYIGIDTFLKVIGACLSGSVLLVVTDLGWQMRGGHRLLPVGIVFIATAYTLVGTSAVRGIVRTNAWFRARVPSRDARNVLVIGAGDAGSLLLRDIENQPQLGLRVAGFLDDDTSKVGRRLRGVRVLGPIGTLADRIESLRVDEVFVALPSARPEERRRILDICTKAGVPTKTTTSLASGHGFGLSDFHAVRIEDLLGREPVRLDLDSLAGSINARVVMITGAAGSIGSELCRNVLRHGPARVVMVDIDESRLYDTWLELRESAPDVFVMRIADIRDRRRVDAIFDEEPVDLVLHAAAYKHVPLMELAPAEAVLTNVLGTRNLLDAARTKGVSRFVFISTDKAVEPSSVMGLTKHVGELLTLHYCANGLSGCIVRFGNVLGSRSSVVPIFETQLRRGGPLQVTHPEVTRYFMTIPEAASLVLQAQAFSRRTDVFVLDMGEPVRILDLAKKMIALSGARIEIVFTGLRPGEKLHEVLTGASESVLPSRHEKILVLTSLPVLGSPIVERIAEMIEAAEENDRAALFALFEEVAPGFEARRARARQAASA